MEKYVCIASASSLNSSRKLWNGHLIPLFERNPFGIDSISQSSSSFLIWKAFNENVFFFFSFFISFIFLLPPASWRSQMGCSNKNEDFRKRGLMRCSVLILSLQQKNAQPFHRNRQKVLHLSTSQLQIFMFIHCSSISKLINFVLF